MPLRCGFSSPVIRSGWTRGSPRLMMKDMKRILRIILGWGCILLGILGLFLPILQGWLFLTMGTALLARDVRFFGRVLCWLERNVAVVRQWMARYRRAKADGEDPFPPC